MYEKYKGDITALLEKNCCVVFNTHRNQYLNELAPPEFNLDHLEDLTDSQKRYYHMVVTCNDIPLFPKWCEEIDTAFRISSLMGLAHITNNLLWNNQFKFTVFLLIDDEQTIVDFEPLVSEDDLEFITMLIDEYMEW